MDSGEEKRGIGWYGDWVIDWDRNRAYRRESPIEYAVYDRDSGHLRYQTEVEIPFYILELFDRK